VSNLLYLGLAVVLSIIGCMVLWLRNRRPRSMNAHMAEFARELEALAPEVAERHGRPSSTPPPHTRES
jgi:hypothetical protein